MTSIVDALKPYQSDVPLPTLEATKKYETLFFGGKLANDLNLLARSSAGWEFFRWQLYNFIDRDVDDLSPLWWGDVAAFCERIGCSDVEGLTLWAESIAPFMRGIVDKLARPDRLELPPLEKINNRPIVELLTGSGVLCRNPDVTWQFNDGEYQLLDEVSLQTILTKCPVDRLTYIAEARDCDKYSLMFKAWLATQGYGNVTIGITSLMLYDGNNNVVGSHSCNIAFYRDSTGQIVAKHIEPQNDSVHNLGEAWVANGIGGAMRSEIYRVSV